MAKKNIRCVCGNFFLAEFNEERKTARCPSCGRNLGLKGPASPPPPTREEVLANVKSSHGPHPFVLPALYAGIAIGLLSIILILTTAPDKNTRPNTNRVAKKPSTTKRFAKKTEAPKPQEQPEEESQKVTKRTPTPEPPKPRKTAPKISSDTALPEELLARVRKEITSLHPFYLNFFLDPDHRVRLNTLMESGRGDNADDAFLRILLRRDRLQFIRAERKSILETAQKLERIALEDLATDRVVLKDGRVLKGTIIEEGPTHIRMERRLSSLRGEMKLERGQIKELQKGKGIRPQFQSRWEKVREGTPEERRDFLAWCSENDLENQTRLAACLVLQSEPDNAKAREIMGLAPTPGAPAMAAGSSEAAPVGGASDPQGGPTITYLNRQWTPAGLKNKLLQDDHALINGKWYSRKEKGLPLPGLFKVKRAGRSPIMISGLSVAEDADIRFKATFDQASRLWRERPLSNVRQRFYAPLLPISTTMKTTYDYNNKLTRKHYVDKASHEPGKKISGQLTLSIPLEAPLIEGSFLARAEASKGGSITAWFKDPVTHQKTVLYQVRGKTRGYQPLPETLQGATRITLGFDVELVAAYSKKRDKYTLQPMKKDAHNRVIQEGIEVIRDRLIPEYNAMIFPSSHNTIEVFRLKAVLGTPAPQLDTLFEEAGQTEILKE